MGVTLILLVYTAPATPVAPTTAASNTTSSTSSSSSVVTNATNTMATTTTSSSSAAISSSVVANTTSSSGNPPPYSRNLESSLRKWLFSSYQVLQRPSEKVVVNISLNLISIDYLDIKSQILSTTGFFQMEWQDNRLAWSTNTSQYGNIIFIFSTETYTWRPAIVVENCISNLKVLSDLTTLIRVTETGIAMWTPGGIFETSCTADVTYYPMDTQECSIVLTTWAYTSSEISLKFAFPEVNFDNLHENGEWILSSVSTYVDSAKRSNKETYTYDRLFFKLKLKRRRLFHILNTIFPVLLMASLICFIFKLPPESGERIGMSLTVLLAYSVYLTIISTNIPTTSINYSILSIYLAIILLLSALSVVGTIIVLDIYFNHQDDEDIPGWLQTLARVVLVRMAMWKGASWCRKARVHPNDFANTPANTKFNIRKGKWIEEPSLTKNGVDKERLSWKEIALIMDRCFMYIFVFSTVICTVTCISILISGD